MKILGRNGIMKFGLVLLLSISLVLIIEATGSNEIYTSNVTENKTIFIIIGEKFTMDTFFGKLNISLVFGDVFSLSRDRIEIPALIHFTIPHFGVVLFLVEFVVMYFLTKFLLGGLFKRKILVLLISIIISIILWFVW